MLRDAQCNDRFERALKSLVVRVVRVVRRGGDSRLLASVIITYWSSSSSKIDLRLLILIAQRPAVCGTGLLEELSYTLVSYTSSLVTLGSASIQRISRRCLQIFSMFYKHTLDLSSVNITRRSKGGRSSGCRQKVDCFHKSSGS